MRIDIKIDGLDQVKRQLGSLARQADFAASKALNTTAFAINTRIKDDMQRVFQGGATPYTLRAFQVDKASKQQLQASVRLRTDAPAGGTPYDKALRHLFTSGTRDWKKLEGLLRGRGLMPAGLMAVPGKDCPLDGRGNIRRPALREMLGSLTSARPGMRVYRRTGAGKAQKAVGYFVVLPNARSHLRPGIYKRIETGSSSALSPMVMFVQPGHWRQFVDLKRIGQDVVGSTFEREFQQALASAIRTAR